MSDLKRLKNITRIADKATAKLEAKNKRIESLVAEIERLESKLRNAHFEGYMAGVGDSEDYDHDPIVMEKIAWKECLED